MVGMIPLTARLHGSVFALIAGLVFTTGTLAPARAQDAADILLRLDRLENENRQLNGQIEELRFQLRRTEDQLKRFQTDADSRFRDLEGGRGSARPATPQPPANDGRGTSGRRSDAFDPNANGSVPGAPRQLGAPGAPLTPPASGGVATPPGMPLPGGALPPGGRVVQGNDIGAPLDVTGRRPPQPDLTPAADNPQSTFAYAKGLFDRGDFEQSEGEFRRFLTSYPRDRRVAEATFWLGETYLRRTRYREAAEQFLNVTTKHSGASRAPEAMLKLGISLRGLGAHQEACGTFDQVTKKYPKASSAIHKAVEREKARAKC